jgi:hypothetical protein
MDAEFSIEKAPTLVPDVIRFLDRARKGVFDPCALEVEFL